MTVSSHDALLIINPSSGTSRKQGLEHFVKKRLESCGWSLDIAYTRGHGDARRFAGDAVASGRSIVLVAGGDGTVNEVADVLCDSPVTLGILPCGSGNGLARHLDIPVDVEEALSIIEKGHVEPVDYGTIASHRFFCTCGMGFDAHIARVFDNIDTRGFNTYLRCIIDCYHSYQPRQYIIATPDGRERRCTAYMLSVCNATQFGNNAFIAPNASSSDGLLDIVILRPPSTLQAIGIGIELMTGLIERNQLIDTLRVSSATITPLSAGPIHIDGEPDNIDGPLTIHCHHGGLKIFTRGPRRPFTPILTPLRNAYHFYRLAIKHLLIRSF